MAASRDKNWHGDFRRVDKVEIRVPADPSMRFETALPERKLGLAIEEWGPTTGIESSNEPVLAWLTIVSHGSDSSVDSLDTLGSTGLMLYSWSLRPTGT